MFIEKRIQMKKKKLKKYRVSPKQSTCFAVSVVDKPAIESSFVVLSEQHPEKFVATEIEGKHMIYGCALRSDFPIYRRSEEGEEYLLEFDADAIDKISKEYFKNGFQKSWTEAHENEIDGLTITESWIKSSPTMDKSIALGLDPKIPVGSWFIGCYCENEDIYQKCLNGEYHGFSVEALISMEEFESMVEKENEKQDSKQINFEDETMSGFLNEIRNMISDALHPQPVEPVTEPVEEQPVEPVEEPKEPEVKDDIHEENNEPVEPVNEPKVEDNHLTELIENLRAELEALKGQNSKLQDRINELSKEPSAKPLNTSAGANKGDSYADWREKMRKLIN